MGEVRGQKRSGVLISRILIFVIGNMFLSLGVVFMIRASLGLSPWDVLHMGLYMQFGLTVGSWAIIVGLTLIALTCLLIKSWPQIGAVGNMLLTGIFIDLFMLIPWLTTPNHWIWKFLMLLLGILLKGYGLAIYIAAKFGAGPRDGLMLAIMKLTGWTVQWVRSGIEISALVLGWLMGGPVFIGTVLAALLIGHVVRFSLPQCQRLIDRLTTAPLLKSTTNNESVESDLQIKE